MWTSDFNCISDICNALLLTRSRHTLTHKHWERHTHYTQTYSYSLSRTHTRTHQSQNHSHKSHGHTPALSSTHEQSLSSKTTSWLCCPALLFIWKDCGLSASLSTTNCPTHAGGGEQHAHTGVLPLAQQASHDDNNNDDDVKDDDAGECCLQNIFFPFDLNMQCTPQRVKGHI